MSHKDRAILSYRKAKAIGLAYDMTINDILSLTPKFWQLHGDPMVLLDGAAMTLLTIQYNLCAGTLARYAMRRPELVSLVEDLLRYRKHGQFMLTELGHGLDISNMETTATLQPSGDFLLNSPTPSSAKAMPPTAPAGLPCVAVVFARLIVDGEFRGHRPFVVPLNDGRQMCTGIQSRLLPFREGPNPVMHSLTTFHNVRLPRSALLGSLPRPLDNHANLMDIIHRVSIGTMAIGCVPLSSMQACATIGAMYSLRRKIGSPTKPVPVLAFRTQHGPILTVTASAYVTQALQRWGIAQFCDKTLDPRVRHGIAAVFKSVMVQLSQQGSMHVSERCGAQGLFAHNQMTRVHSEIRGLAIAEGDVLVLSIRLINELLLGRYALPPSTNPDSLLARHEIALFAELRAIAAESPNHRSEEVSRRVLPRCQPMMEAIGHRMAYDAAVAQGVRPALVDLFVANALQFDAAWYAECAGVGRAQMQAMQESAMDRVLPILGELVAEMDVFAYVSAPIVSDERWGAFVEGLATFEGTAHVDALEPAVQAQPEMVRSHL
ncbi:Acyl-coenzyme A oxidase 2, peroxisomal [Trametes pubescens]|uniref:Acyl-coenzyme A oxidase 2, peroxisomal n=1 Tax=Trametes pubescens TaxID=154538 RepID=A0A1M2VBW2_TRAPU|nr:Acyl-coenzyme A oxidase 2, peroxisomal [Trametes pubescens]